MRKPDIKIIKMMNLNISGKNRIRRMMILSASRKKGRKKKGKTSRPGRALMNPGRGK